MNINIEYINGIVDATIDFYETSNGRIDPDKELEVSYVPIQSSKDGKVDIGCQVTMTWKTEASHVWSKDSIRDDNYLKIYSKDKVGSVISDLSSMLSDIDKVQLTSFSA